VKDILKSERKDQIMDDKDIIRLYFERAEDAIGKTAEKYGALCHTIAKNILGNDEDAKECVNDTYFAVWNRIPPEKPNSFCAFIGKIARNIALTRLDYNMASCRNGNADIVLDELAEILPDENVDMDAEGEALMRALNLFLSREKERSRVIFVRRYFHCESMAEIAKKVHMQESAVRSSLFRTRKKLAIYLRKQGLGGNYVEKESKIARNDESYR
jgi:RNA polymerase sigma-70 factor (ECF subfamily)